MKSRMLVPLVLVACCATLAAAAFTPHLTQVSDSRPNSTTASAPHAHNTFADWPSSTPEEQGMNSEHLARLLEDVRDNEHKIRSILIVKNDHLILEAYGHPYNRETVHDVKSVSKSVISALVGIAIDEGVLSDVHQLVHELIPGSFLDSNDSTRRDITLEHLLTMSSGLDVDENGPAMNEIISHEDFVSATFARPMIERPGETFRYCTFLTLAMTRILTEASGVDLLDFATTHLFQPLQFGDIHWETDQQGYRFGGDRLWLRPIDMAKFGSLFLHGGKWQGNQIVPESWVSEATTNRYDGFDRDGYTGYGYWWWLPGNGRIRARGAFGQIITVYPDLNMIVVFTGADNYAWEALTSNYILPAISGEQSIPANDGANERLERLVESLGSPEPSTPNVLPDIAHEVSGHRYLLDRNDLEFSEISFTFDHPAEGRLQILHPDGTLDLGIGLDGVYRVTPNVRWGMRSDGNVLALRGEWVSETRFVLEIQEVGEAFYLDLNLEFSAEEVSGVSVWQPLGWEVPIAGSRVTPQ